ncbi:MULTISPECIES: GNAT family N-acetyltransferase [unclassified Shinella]|uniref:GNAT family N-acetyltransferase n=1 Tax=unclassified Shinella TaxID=2643062 RepID=UPI00234F3CD2|nr:MULTISPECIES: GNAT family N-acetyltransferase [unclassified Shinella]MCO5155001.1 GNAT family N-acetyltransferase [Shinella sp.]MDC7260439.1 GNAT family N-acetyltransferase [Shinella sp. HY16]MDC7267334.1 GNAT family N-acetyltransferase [Shinella sp. YZ44]
MSLSDYFTRKPAFDIFPLETADASIAAALHRARFPQPWNDGEFHSLLLQEPVYGFLALKEGALGRMAGGFVLARAAAGEAEILTIGVDGRFSRAGLGWRLMQAALREAKMRGAEDIFLEVDEGNVAARGLYAKLGFAKVGERKAYYVAADGYRSTALVLRRDLR